MAARIFNLLLLLLAWQRRSSFSGRRTGSCAPRSRCGAGTDQERTDILERALVRSYNIDYHQNTRADRNRVAAEAGKPIVGVRLGVCSGQGESGVTRLLENPDEQLRKAAGILRGGGTVAFPTETVYGLGAHALDAQAVARVFEAKKRPRFDPLIVHVHSLEQARQIVHHWPPTAIRLASRFWPGPLTLVLPKSDAIPGIVTAGLPNVALRMPDHPLALALISEAGVPVAAPSANKFGSISPTTASHVREQLGQCIDMVLDGGPCRVGIESTIISLVDDAPTLLRAGGVALEEIERVLGPVKRLASDAARNIAPGQSPRHYAPRTPLRVCDDPGSLPIPPRAGLLTLALTPAGESFEAVEVLSERGDLHEAAANFFVALHRLDAMDLDCIVAVRMPEAGLGLAMNDRLQRAAYRAPDE